MKHLVRAAAVALVIAGPPAAAQETPLVPTLRLTGTGIASAPPDTAIITMGVVTQAKTAGPALTENNGRMSELMAQLATSGVARRDIGTTGFRIEPVFVYPSVGDDDAPPEVTGYRVDNSIRVKVRDITKAEDLLDKVVRIGANQVQGIEFTIENDRALLDRARVDAVRAAEAKAKVYSDAGKFGLGRLLSVSESVSTLVDPGQTRMSMQAGSVPIAPGERDLAVTVEMEWEIQPRR